MYYTKFDNYTRKKMPPKKKKNYKGELKKVEENDQGIKSHIGLNDMPSEVIFFFFFNFSL